MYKCKLCEKNLCFRWTDTHGVAVCANCGLPYTVYHYKDDKRVEKPPEVAIKESWIPLGKKYWYEHRQMVFPASYDIGILASRDSSYSGATASDIKQFDNWLNAHESEFPTD